MLMKPSARIAIAVMLLACAAALAQDENPLIGEVAVEGNDYVAREPILDVVKDVLKVGEEFTDTKAAEARRLVLRMGYFDDVTLSVEPLEQGVRVVITVVEKQRIEQVMFAGNTVISDDELAAAILSQPGHVADERAIGRDVRRIEDYYEKKGYIAKVSEAIVDAFGVLTFVVEEARLEDIIIEGLTRTKEWLVHQELRLEPGELFQQAEVTTGIQRVYGLGLFEEVDTDIRPGLENPLKDIILVIKLTEAKTGRAAFAMAYSSLDEFVVMLSASESNLRGRGERASVTVELGGRESYEFSFFEPYLDRGGTTLELNVFDTERRRRFVGGAMVSLADSEFDERRTGGNVTVTGPISDHRNWSFRFRTEEVSSSFFQGTTTLPPGIGLVPAGNGVEPSDLTGGGAGTTVPDDPDLMPDLPEPGDLTTPIQVAAPLHPGGRVNSFTLGLIDDTRDVRANPRSGAFSSLSFEQAGGLVGGGTEFGKIQLDHRRYHEIGGGDVVALRLMGGTTFGSPPLFESFSIGGANTLRGYELDRWRGESLALANVEYRRPITDTLTAVGFVDVGTAWGGAFETVVPGFEIKADDQEFAPHAGAGVGLRVVTPIGPIRLDMGWGEDGSRAHFSFGHTF